MSSNKVLINYSVDIKILVAGCPFRDLNKQPYSTSLSASKIRQYKPVEMIIIIIITTVTTYSNNCNKKTTKN